VVTSGITCPCTRRTGATLGVGLTGQYREQFGRKLLGGLLGTVLGGVGRAVVFNIPAHQG